MRPIPRNPLHITLDRRFIPSHLPPAADTTHNDLACNAKRADALMRRPANSAILRVAESHSLKVIPAWSSGISIRPICACTDSLSEIL
jgi:hypothetical protein